MLWSNQVDAAAIVGADAKVDDGGRDPTFGRREEVDDVKGREGKKMKRTPRSYL